MIDTLLYFYGAFGLAVGLGFSFFGANRSVEGASQSSWTFRLWILPSTILLWPLAVWIWLTKRVAAPEHVS
ncbi:MAG: hypothetical protein AAFZ38_03495 [Myxococcota bacterium]